MPQSATLVMMPVTLKSLLIGSGPPFCLIKIYRSYGVYRELVMLHN